MVRMETTNDLFVTITGCETRDLERYSQRAFSQNTRTNRREVGDVRSAPWPQVSG